MILDRILSSKFKLPLVYGFSVFIFGGVGLSVYDESICHGGSNS
jgi:hypothetical protein